MNRDVNIFINRRANKCGFEVLIIEGRSVPPPPIEILSGALVIIIGMFYFKKPLSVKIFNLKKKHSSK